MDRGAWDTVWDDKESDMTEWLKQKKTYRWSADTWKTAQHNYQFSSVTHSCLIETPWIAVRQAFLSITNSGAFSNSCPSSQWCHPTISSSVVPFSSRLQSLPASRSFPVSQFFTSGGQNIGASASASVLPMTIQDWFPLGLTGLISLFNILFSTKRKRFGPWCN